MHTTQSTGLIFSSKVRNRDLPLYVGWHLILIMLTTQDRQTTFNACLMLEKHHRHYARGSSLGSINQEWFFTS